MLKFQTRSNLGGAGGQETARALELNTKEQATQRLKRLGHSGQLPWCVPEVALASPYMYPSTLVIISTAHALLCGLLRRLLNFAFTTMVTTVPNSHPININIGYDSDSRLAVTVCNRSCHK
jgi:hypothetical protein